MQLVCQELTLKYFSDINECEENPSICSYQCKNIQGGFECICAPGQVRLADRRSCAG